MRLRAAPAAAAQLREIRRSALARDVGPLWASEVLVLVMGLVQAVVVARLLGPAAFGAAALITGVTTLVFTIVDPRAEEAVVRFLEVHRADHRPDRSLAVAKLAYLVSLGLAVVAFVAIVLSAGWGEDAIVRTDGAAGLIVLFGAASLFAAPAATSRSVLVALRWFRTVAAVQVGAAALRSVLAIVLAQAGVGMASLVLAAAMSLVVESVVASVAAHLALRSAFGGAWWRAPLRSLEGTLGEIVRFIGYSDLTSLVAVFAKEADLLVLGAVRGATEAGYYRLARSAVAPLASVITPLQQVVYPRLASMAAAGDAAALRSAMRLYGIRVGVPMAALVALALPAIPLVIPFVVGKEFSGGVDAALILLAGGVVTLPLFWVRPMLLVTGHVRALLALSVGATLASLVGYFLLGDLMGASGVALTRVLAAGVGGSLASLWYCRRRCQRGDLVSPRPAPGGGALEGGPVVLDEQDFGVPCTPVGLR